MRPAIVIDGGHLEYTLLFKEGPYFFIVHADLVPAVHLFHPLLEFHFRYTLVSPKACKLTIARTSSRDSQIAGAIRSYTLRRSRNSSFWTCLCVLRALTRTQNTQTCITTYGRRRRPTCTELMLLQFKKPWNICENAGLFPQ